MAYIKLNNQLLNTDFIYSVDTNPETLITINSKKGMHQITKDEWDDIKGDLIACSNFKEITNYGYVNLDLVVDVWKTDDNYYTIKFGDITKNLSLTPENTEGLDETVFDEIKAYVKATGGGTGGTTNYDALTNKPKINGKSLTGNKTAADLGLASKDELDAKANATEITALETKIANSNTEITQIKTDLTSKANTVDLEAKLDKTEAKTTYATIASVGDATTLKTVAKNTVDAINEIKDAQTTGGYTLPVASPDSLGGIKVGDNLTIDGDGKLNATGGGTAYVAGNGININDTTIVVDEQVVATKTDLEAKQDKLTAGNGIEIGADNTIKSTYTFNDTELKGLITAEETARTTKDTELSNKITALETTVGNTTLDTTAKDLTAAVNELNTKLVDAGKVDGATLDGVAVTLSNKILEITLPKASDTTAGIAKIGTGLKVEQEAVAVDTALFMDKTTIQGELDKKQNTLTAGEGIEIIGDNIAAKKATHDVLGSITVGEGLIANDGLVTVDKTKLPVLVYADNSQSIPANTIVIHANDLYICREDIASTSGWVNDERKMEPVDTNSSEMDVIDYDAIAEGTEIKKGKLVVHLNADDNTTKLYIVKSTFFKTATYDDDKANLVETALQIDLAEYYKKTEVDAELAQKASLTLPTITAGEKLVKDQLAVSENGELTRVKEDIASYVDEATDGSKLEPIATKSSVDTIKSELGTVATLNTTAKDNVVNAINELKTELADAGKVDGAKLNGTEVSITDKILEINIPDASDTDKGLVQIGNGLEATGGVASVKVNTTNNYLKVDTDGVDVDDTKFVKPEELEAMVIEIPLTLTHTNATNGWNALVSATKDTINNYLSIADFKAVYEKAVLNKHSIVKFKYGLNTSDFVTVNVSPYTDNTNNYLRITISGSFWGMGTYNTTNNTADFAFGTIMLNIGANTTMDAYTSCAVSGQVGYTCTQALYDTITTKSSMVTYKITG